MLLAAPGGRGRPGFRPLPMQPGLPCYLRVQCSCSPSNMHTPAQAATKTGQERGSPLGKGNMKGAQRRGARRHKCREGEELLLAALGRAVRQHQVHGVTCNCFIPLPQQNTKWSEPHLRPLCNILKGTVWGEHHSRGSGCVCPVSPPPPCTCSGKESSILPKKRLRRGLVIRIHHLLPCSASHKPSGTLFGRWLLLHQADALASGQRLGHRGGLLAAASAAAGGELGV